MEYLRAQDALLILLVTACAVTDFRSWRIPDAFTYPAMIAGLAINAMEGPDRLLWAIAGLAAGLLVLYPGYRIGGVGAGDLKLMAAVGALQGLWFVLSAAVAGTIAGALMALVVIVSMRRGGVMDILKRSVSVARLLVSPGRNVRIPPAIRRASVPIPFGVAIAIGTLTAWWFHWPW
jgi:prepilin peptidase CpaA